MQLLIAIRTVGKLTSLESLSKSSISWSNSSRPNLEVDSTQQNIIILIFSLLISLPLNCLTSTSVFLIVAWWTNKNVPFSMSSWNTIEVNETGFGISLLSSSTTGQMECRIIYY